MINYKALNTYLEDVSKSKKINKLLETLPFTGVLARNIINMNYPENSSPNQYLSIVDSIDIVSDFFNSIDSKLNYYFLNIMSFSYEQTNFCNINSEKEVVAYKKKLLEKYLETRKISNDKYTSINNQYTKLLNIKIPDSSIDVNGKVNIYFQNNTRDLFIIVHEFMHKFFYQPDSDAVLKFYNFNFLAEVSSITMEFLLKDYLVSRNINIDDATKEIIASFNMVRKFSYNFLFEVLVHNCYLKYGFINDKIINEAIFKEKNLILQNAFLKYKDAYLANLEKNGYSFMYLQRYIVATVLACTLTQEIRKDSAKVSILYNISDHIYENDLIILLKSVNLNFLEKDNFFSFLKVNHSKINLLIKNYKNELNRVDINKDIKKKM